MERLFPAANNMLAIFSLTHSGATPKERTSRERAASHYKTNYCAKSTWPTSHAGERLGLPGATSGYCLINLSASNVTVVDECTYQNGFVEPLHLKRWRLKIWELTNLGCLDNQGQLGLNYFNWNVGSMASYSGSLASAKSSAFSLPSPRPAISYCP